MPKLIKDGEIVEDSWSIQEKSDESINLSTLDSNLSWIIPIKAWREADKSALPKNVGIWLDSDDNLNDLNGSDLAELPVIAINFPIFADGRGFSLTRIIREQLEYPGELRAIGNFMLDQIFPLRRCGITTFLVPEETDLDSVKDMLNSFSDSYQAAADETRPLFRRRKNA